MISWRQLGLVAGASRDLQQRRRFGSTRHREASTLVAAFPPNQGRLLDRGVTAGIEARVDEDALGVPIQD